MPNRQKARATGQDNPTGVAAGRAMAAVAGNETATAAETGGLKNHHRSKKAKNRDLHHLLTETKKHKWSKTLPAFSKC